VRKLALACIATVAVADYVIHRTNPSWFALGPFDHAAHVATAALFMPQDRPAGWKAGYLAGSLLPDVDHVPVALRDPEPGQPRPRTHSFLSLGPALLGSPAVAAGMATHYLRDLSLEPGVPFFGGRHLRLPYAAYALLLAVAAYWKGCGGSRSSS
jgi:hypothetical protein